MMFRHMARSTWQATSRSGPRTGTIPSTFADLRSSITDNPTGPSSRSRQSQLVVKGGSKTWGLTHREGVPMEKRLPYLGFRCVLQVENTIAGTPGTPSPSPGIPKSTAPAPGRPVLERFTLGSHPQRGHPLFAMGGNGITS